MDLDLQPVLDLQPAAAKLDLQPVQQRAPLELKPTEPKSLPKRIGTAIREALSPLIGPTEAQRMRDAIEWNGEYVYKPLGDRAAQEGLFPAASHPMIPIPRIPEVPDSMNVTVPGLVSARQLAALANTGLSFLEFAESPLGLATGGLGKLGISAGAPATPRVIAGGYAADLGLKVPEAATQAGEISVTGTEQQALEAELGLATQVVLPGVLGKHALAPGRGPVIVKPDGPKVFSEFGGDVAESPVRSGPLDIRPTTDKEVAAPTQPEANPQTTAAAGAPATQTLPELPATLHGQIVKLRAGKAPAVLFGPQDVIPDWALKDERYQVTDTPDGRVLYDTAAWSADEIQRLVAAGQTGTILGYGVPAKPAQPIGAVTVRDKAGLELRSVVVDEATQPAALDAAKRYADEGDQVALEPLETVLAKRLDRTGVPRDVRTIDATAAGQAYAQARAEREAAAAKAKVEGSKMETETPSSILNPPSSPKVTEAHLEQARQAVADLKGEERAPDIFDDLEGVTRGPIQFPAELQDVIDASRERVAQALHSKTWKRLSSAQRKAIDKQLRATTGEGFAADEAIGGLGEKYQGLSVDDFANEILDAGEARLLQRRKEDSAEVKQLAREIAEAEAQSVTPSSASRAGLVEAVNQSDQSAPPSTQPTPGRQLWSSSDSSASTSARKGWPFDTNGPRTRTTLLDDPATGRKVHQIPGDVNSLAQGAKAMEAGFSQALRGIAGAVPGVEFNAARLKSADRLASKLKTRPAHTVSDYLGGRFLVEDPAALLAAHDAIVEKFNVLDIDNKLGGEQHGYRAVHYQVRLPNGMSAEIQVIPKALEAARSEAHKVHQAVPHGQKATPEQAKAARAAQRKLDKAWEKWGELKAADVPAELQPFEKPERPYQAEGLPPAKPPKPGGQKFVVYRLGWADETTGRGRYVGTADRVARHINHVEEKGMAAGDTVFAYEVDSNQVELKPRPSAGNELQAEIPVDAEARLLWRVPLETIYDRNPDSMFELTAKMIERAAPRAADKIRETAQAADAARQMETAAVALDLYGSDVAKLPPDYAARLTEAYQQELQLPGQPAGAPAQAEAGALSRGAREVRSQGGTREVIRKALTRRALATLALEPIKNAFERTKGNRLSSLDVKKFVEQMPAYNVVGQKIENPVDFAKTLVGLRSPYQESLKIVLLNKDQVVLHSQVLYVGTIDTTSVSFADVGRLVKKYPKTTGMLISHNHPSGEVTPSDADIKVTGMWQDAAKRAGIRLVDHVITNGHKFYSLATYKEQYIPDAVQLAPWEIMRRGELQRVDNQTSFEALVSTLRQANPDVAHIIYLNTRLNVTAIEKVEPKKDTIAKAALAGAGIEGAKNIMLDYGPSVDIGTGMEITRNLNAWLRGSNVEIKDWSVKGLPSAKAGGYHHYADAPAGAGEHVAETPAEYERATGRKIRATELISDQTKAAIQEYLYDPRSNLTDRQQAIGIVMNQGVDAAMQLWRNPPTWMPGAVRSKLLGAITQRLGNAERAARASNNPAEADALASQQADLWNEALPQITNTAQELQAMADLVLMSPDAHVTRARREIQRAGDAEVDRHAGETEAMRQALDQGRAAGVEAVKADAETNQAARAAVDDTVKNSEETRRAIVMELADPWAKSPEILAHARESVRAKANELLNSAPRPPQFTPAQHLRQILDDLAGRAAGIFSSHIQGAEPGVPLLQKLQQRLGLDKEHATKLASSLSREWDKQLNKARKKIDERLAAARARQERREREAESNTAVDRALRRQLRALNIKLGEAIRQAAADRQKTGDSIVDKILAQSGLTGDKADALRVRLTDRWNKLVAESQQRALEAIAGRAGVKISRKMRTAFDRLVELDRLAPVDGDVFFNTVRSALKVPELTEAQARELRQLVLDAQGKPEGWQQQRLMAKALTLVEQAKGSLAWHDVPFSIWYANIFSAPPTHAANLIGNTVKALEVIGLNALRNPANAAGTLRAFARGFETGGLEAANVMLTGQLEGTRSLKAEPARPLEAQMQKGGIRKTLLPWAAVGRLLAAEDVLFFKGHEEVKWQQLARRLARDEGLRGEALDARVQNILHNTRAEYDAAKVQAASEGLKGLDLRRRAHEIIEQKREADLPGSLDMARRFGLEHTFNSEPYGVMGSIAEVLNTMNRKLVVTRFAAPVVRIIANLANESLNYFPPVGLARVTIPRFRQDIVARAGGDVDALRFAQARAMVGTVMFASLAAVVANSVDDPDAPLQITGVGPRTKDQREQLRQTGWKPNALKLGNRWYSYQESHLSIPLAILGNYSDAVKYGSLEHQDALNRTAYTVQMLGNTIFEQRMLSGVSDLMATLEPGGDGKELGNLLARTGGSFVAPNAVKWVDQVFDPNVYTPDDIRGALYAQTPFARRLNRPALNALGDEVTRSAVDRFTSPVKADPLMVLLASKAAWVPMPNLDEQTVGNPKLGADYQRPMTPDEYYQWIAASGPEIRRRLTERIDYLAALPKAEAQAYVREVTRETRAKTKPK